MKFNSQIAVVTGGATGIGNATCHKLQKECAIVYNLDIHPSSSNDINFIYCDVRNYSDVQNTIHQIFEKEGRIDLLFANAGVHFVGTIEETAIENFENVLAINLKGVFFTLKATLPFMKANNKGAIVVMGSDQSLIGKGNSSVYGLTKGAVGQLTKSTAIDYAAFNIRINCICPGTIDTPLLTKAIERFDAVTQLGKENIHRILEDAQPIKRIAQPEEIANVVCFLLSEESSFMTGALVAADGGYTCQ
ncbi:MAG: hypothetical protein RLY16_2469 [Bacteroidota bacterium]|jgi:NAD(P)-dependent dehydrogenase (short-subunit alcohol dehydrogenase family)